MRLGTANTPLVLNQEYSQEFALEHRDDQEYIQEYIKVSVQEDKVYEVYVHGVRDGFPSMSVFTQQDANQPFYPSIPEAACCPLSPQRTIQRRIEDALLQLGHLRNALIRHRESARSSHRHAFSFKLQNAHLTELHRHDPVFNSYARKLLESVAREVNKSYSTYFKGLTWPNCIAPRLILSRNRKSPSRLRMCLAKGQVDTSTWVFL